VVDTLFTTADLAEMRAFGAANRPHTAAVEAWTRTREPGGTYVTTWVGVSGQGALPCRAATVGTPAERLASGTFAEVKEMRVAFDVDVMIPSENRRIILTHDIPGLASPVTLYVTGSEARTFEMERIVLCTTEGGA
jgi:hypothetical protein